MSLFAGSHGSPGDSGDICLDKMNQKEKKAMKMKRCLSLFMSILLLISLCSVGYFSASAGSWNYGTGYSEDDDGNLIISDNVDNTAAWQETFDASKGFLAGYQIHFNSTMFNSTHFVRNTNSDEGIFMRLQRHPESGVGYRFIMQGSVNGNWTNELVRTDIDCDDDTVQVVLLHAKGSDELTVRVNNEFGMTLYSTTLNVGTVGAAPGWFDGFNELRVGGEVVYGDNSGETHQAVVSAELSPVGPISRPLMKPRSPRETIGLNTTARRLWRTHGAVSPAITKTLTRPMALRSPMMFRWIALTESLPLSATATFNFLNFRLLCIRTIVFRAFR